MADELGLAFDGDFYGWDVRGAHKMPLIAHLMTSLGFRRVVGILDGNKTELAAKMRTEFSQYKFITIQADDVRSKPAVQQKPAVNGLLDHQARIPPARQDDARRLIGEVNAALGQQDLST